MKKRYSRIENGVQRFSFVALEYNALALSIRPKNAQS
jgi:hypothetical protein